MVLQVNCNEILKKIKHVTHTVSETLVIIRKFVVADYEQLRVGLFQRLLS